MGLNTLRQVLEKRGPEYVDQFLSDNIIITEKLDTYRILFENVNGELKFFKKDNTEITLVERTLTDIWETALVEIPILVGDMALQEGIRFGVAYTPVERPIRLPYSKLPSYILTDVTKREKNKVIEVYEYDEVHKWAQLLTMARPPIIFEGSLNEDQKNMIIDYARGDYEDKETSFSRILEKSFGKTYSEEPTLEGIIIKKDNELMQVVSYEFELLDEAYKRRRDNKSSRDLYDLVLFSINNFLDSYAIPVMEAESPDQVYINIVCDIFNKYCDRNPIQESLDSKYLTPPSFGHSGNLNRKFVHDDKTKKILDKGEIYESMFKIFLSSLRRYKKEYGLLNESAANKFNTHVWRIQNQVNKDSDFEKSLNENVEIIKEDRSNNVVIKAFDRKRHSDIDNMRVIASIQKAFSPKGLKVKRGTEPCVVYVTDLVPFTNAQMENVIAMNKSWNAPVIIAAVGNDRRAKGEKFHLSDNLLKAQLNAIAINSKDMVPNYFLLDDWDLREIFEYVRPQYEPVALITDKGKKSDFIIQLYFEDEIMGGRIGSEPEFNIGEMEADDKLKAIRAIQDDVFVKFRDLTPQPVWSLFDSISSEYKSWAGTVLKPLESNKLPSIKHLDK